jgi:hypothetical protein
LHTTWSSYSIDSCGEEEEEEEEEWGTAPAKEE